MEFPITKNNPKWGVSNHVPRLRNPSHATVRRQFGIQVFVLLILAYSNFLSMLGIVAYLSNSIASLLTKADIGK
jgi:hypothetical protein